MKFSVGDPVYIRSNDEEGTILEIIDAQTFKVRAGTATYHAFLDDLEHPYLRWFLDKNKKKKPEFTFIDQIQKEKSGARKRILNEGVYLVFFPVYKSDGFDEIIDKVKIYFYNETDRQYRFEYSVKNKVESLFEIENQLLPNSEFYIHDLAFSEIANHPQFTYKFTDMQDYSLELEATLPLKPKKLFEYLDKIKFDNHAFFSLILFAKIEPRPVKEFIPEPIHLKANLATKTGHFDFAHALQKSQYEIDLHIEKLTPNHKNLSSGEKLQIQLKEFHNAIDLAIVTHKRSVVFIHGVGKGTLKGEIHKILLVMKQTKSIKEYVNSYDKRYGYGATEVYFH